MKIINKIFITISILIILIICNQTNVKATTIPMTDVMCEFINISMWNQIENNDLTILNIIADKDVLFDKDENNNVTLIKDDIIMTLDEFKLLCRCTEAETGGRTFESKVAVAEVIINRYMYNEFFPNTVEEVIYQKNQFAVVKDGSINKKIPENSTILACMKALSENSYPDNMLFFRADYYFEEYTNYIEIDGTFFSVYEKRK